MPVPYDDFLRRMQPLSNNRPQNSTQAHPYWIEQDQSYPEGVAYDKVKDDIKVVHFCFGEDFFFALVSV